MAIKIPQSVFDKYYEVVDSTFDIFGVTCQLAFNEKQEIDNSFDNVPTNPSIAINKRDQQFTRLQNQVIENVETLEDIKLKVYFDSKHFQGAGANMVLPNGSIQTIFFATDLPRIMRASALIVHKDISDLQYMRFRRLGEPFPMGIKLIRYFGCFWERN